MENGVYTIEDYGMLKILEHLYIFTRDGRRMKAGEIRDKVGLELKYWVILTNNEIIQLQGIAQKPIYRWIGIQPNIKMASKLLSEGYDLIENLDKKETIEITENEKSIITNFHEFWELYDKKEDKIKCEKAWNKLRKTERDLIFEKLPAYINATPDKTYRKNPLNYLNNKCWENEIITYIKPTSNEQKNISIEYALSKATIEQLMSEVRRRGGEGEITFKQKFEFKEVVK